ncbi:class I SAM-dependent DNA methyltransferase [Foetidibacter luteolus]|uniref:class I SAM-dependent DNA methyltransferase n=1 Tax=Foetidibacter luteolus TaxID=2608880 RepID=UPI00129AC6CB|nr:class I SAM-dependent methyltransferase [Foetidibacter luteolus]
MITTSPFDIMAGTYDSDFTATRIGKLQRDKVWKLLLPVLNRYQKPLNILELNCGTGEDAVRLAALGHYVCATDASAAMIEQARQKASGQNIQGGLELQVCSFANISAAFANRHFDLVLSNFGGLNCIDDKEMQVLCNSLSTLTTNGAVLVFVVMGRFCLWEMLYYTVKLDFKRAFRRLQKFTLFKAGENQLPVYYYHPWTLQKIFRQHFKKQQVNPVGFFVPPSYLERYFAAKPSWLNRFNRWDNGWGNHTMFSAFADHFCMILKKKGQ